MRILSVVILLYSFFLMTNASGQNKRGDSEIDNVYRFDFGNGKTLKGFTHALPEHHSAAGSYTLQSAGMLTTNSHVGKGPRTDGYITCNAPFYFSVVVPEGNYRVKITVGDDDGMADISIRAECRRMMVNRLQTKKGQHEVVEFTLHIRDSLIRGTDKRVRLKPREHQYLHWDNQLTLEFVGPAPKVNAIEIMPEQFDVVTVFLAGNSTVVDGAHEPYAAWGQMVPAFFKPGKVAIANYAESGESVHSFIAERRFDKIIRMIKPGDYVFVEFGHNDQKQKGDGVGAFTTYKRDLVYFIDEVQHKGGRPVIVTSVQRRKFNDSGRIEETLGDYPAAGRQTAQEQGVPLIDLNALSKTMYEAWGPEKSVDAFVHFPANTFPGQTSALEDDTHFRPFGAYEVAKLVIKGIRDAQLPLAEFIGDDIGSIDPSKPGLLSGFYWPLSGSVPAVKPDGN